DNVKVLAIDYHGNNGNDVTLADNTVAAKDLKVTPDVINEGQQVALTGTLFGSEPNGQLFLKILWGDGSPPELHNPGRTPFRFTHTYVNNPAGQPSGGTYTITAFWF